MKAFRSRKSAPVKVKDKAYQLRTLCETLNKGAKRTFKLGRFVSFDEGGVASRSRLNPLRQYNKDKPHKFRVEFFILASAMNYFVYHFAPYEGKNATNNFISQEAREYATTQKAVINSIIDSELSNDSLGARILACDNRYTAFPLFMDLRNNHDIYAVGTIRKNRKGWDEEIMNLKKSSERGSSKITYDKYNHILCFQWNDNKVVSGISTLPEYGYDKVKRRVGKDIKEFKLPGSLKSYQKYMSGVDNFDQIRDSGGGCSKGIKKTNKWFQKIILALLDAGVAQGSIAHNMFAKSQRGMKARLKAVPIFTYQKFLAKMMVNFSGFRENCSIASRIQIRPSIMGVTNEYQGQMTNDKSHVCASSSLLWRPKFRPFCRVCRLEKDMMKGKVPGGASTKEGHGARSKRNMVICKTCKDVSEVDIYLHLCQCHGSNNRIF